MPPSKLGLKIVGAFLVVVIILATMAMFSILETQEAMIESVGTDGIHTAEFIAAVVDRTIYLKYHELWNLGNDDDVIYCLAQSNSEYDAMADPYGYMASVDAEWVGTPMDEYTPLMEEILSTNISILMTELLTHHYLEEHGLGIYARAALVNKYGAVIAMTERTIDFRKDDKPFWPDLLDDGHYFSDATIDPVTGSLGVRVCARLDTPSGHFAGVIVAVVDVIAVAEESVYLGKVYETTETHIVTSDGRLLYSDGVFSALEDVTTEEFFSEATEASGYFIGRENDQEKLFAYSHSTGYLRYPGNNWSFFVAHNTAEVLSDVSTITWRVVLASVAAIGAAVVVSSYYAHSLSTRVRRIAEAAGRFSDGDFGETIPVGPDDEIGELARSLNSMADELETLYGGLETKVKERTKELEQATKKLHLLGSITRHDALNQVSVITGWIAVIEDMTEDREVTEKLAKISEACLNLQRYLEFTGVYERVGVKAPEWMDLGTALTHSLFGLAPHKFRLHNGLSGVVVYGDRMLPKVLRNLVDNSIAHGGDVRSVSFSYEEVPDGLKVVYEDDGVGIPQELKGNLFQRRVHQGRVSFGLYLSKEILAITGITISETGVPGRGARFEILIPEGYYRMDGGQRPDGA